jgi:hypothetical protein
LYLFAASGNNIEKKFLISVSMSVCFFGEGLREPFSFREEKGSLIAIEAF